jgi:hypothetical protein
MSETLLAFHIEPEVTQRLSEMAAKLGYDLLCSFLHNNAVDFFAQADSPVSGTKYWVYRLRFRPETIDHQLRAALRAKGFEL